MNIQFTSNQFLESCLVPIVDKPESYLSLELVFEKKQAKNKQKLIKKYKQKTSKNQAKMSEKNKQKSSKNESRITQAKNKGALEFSLVLVKKKQEKT
jgi:hypothetical protein